MGELERYNAVTLDDIKRVTGQYFAPTNRTILDVVPARAAAAQAAAPARKPATAAPTPPAQPKAPAPAAAPKKEQAQ
jgi:hypothetical protein